MSSLRQIPAFTHQHIYRGALGNDIVAFGSVEAFLRVVRRHSFANEHDSDWTGDSYETTLRCSETGDERLVPQATAQIEKLRVTLPDRQPMWCPDIAGDHVVVPEFVSGIAEHMRRKMPNETTSVPIRILFDTTSSAMIDAGKLKARGTVVLALLMQLVAERPVEFWVGAPYSTSPEVGLMVRVPTAPFNLGMAAYLLTNVGFTRTFMYGIMRHTLHWPGTWASTQFINRNSRSGYADDSEVIENTRRFFALADQDLVIPPAISVNYTDIWQNPLKWINNRIEECRHYEPA